MSKTIKVAPPQQVSYMVSETESRCTHGLLVAGQPAIHAPDALERDADRLIIRHG